jgi:hypothetical protein
MLELFCYYEHKPAIKSLHIHTVKAFFRSLKPEILVSHAKCLRSFHGECSNLAQAQSNLTHKPINVRSTVL